MEAEPEPAQQPGLQPEAEQEPVWTRLQELEQEPGQPLPEEGRDSAWARATESRPGLLQGSEPEPLPGLHCWPARAVSCSHRQEAGLPGRAEE